METLKENTKRELRQLFEKGYLTGMDICLREYKACRAFVLNIGLLSFQEIEEIEHNTKEKIFKKKNS
jgi:predicted component of type VI protein secretion system